MNLALQLFGFKKERLEFNENNQNYYIALVFTLILFVFELFSYCGYNSPPPSTDESAMWKDVLYWGIYCLVEEYIHNKSEQIFMYILILFTVGFELITHANWSTHLFYSQYGFNYGLGLMLFFLLLFSKFIEQGHSWYQYISLNMFFCNNNGC